MYVPYSQPILCYVLRELCAIRDDNSTCDVADVTSGSRSEHVAKHPSDIMLDNVLHWTGIVL